MIFSRLAPRIYMVALRAFPHGHRAVYAAEMRDTFEHELAVRVRDRGFWSAFRFVVAAWFNAMSEGFGERRRHRRSVYPAGPRHPFGGFARDLMHAVRSLAKARAFTFVCVLSLGIGMATVIAILTLVRAVLGVPSGINPSGFVQLVVTPLGPLRTQAGESVIETWSYPDFMEVRDANTGMAVTGWAVGTTRFRLREGDGATREATMYVSPNYFMTVGAVLARGRGFDAARRDGAPAGLTGSAQNGPAVIVGYRFWQDRLGADPEIIGRTITLNRVAHVVVGVAPERYRGHLSPEGTPDVQLWLPLDDHPRLHGEESVRFNREVEWVQVIGRLSPGTTLAHANGAVASIMAGLARQYPKTNEFKSGAVETYHALGARGRSDAIAAQAMFFGISGVVLLIVCLNVSGMMLVRSAARERELALRQAIGASRGRLMQYLLSEALVLAFLGGTLAVAVLFGVPAALAWWFEFWHPDLDLFVPDAWTYAACLGLCFVTTLVFGLVPAIRFSRSTLVVALKDDAGGGGSRRVGRVHRLTAAIQAGIAVPFLVMGGVKLDQVRTTAAADVGFETKGLFFAPVDLDAGGHDVKDAPTLLRTVRENLAQATGVESVALADGLPLDFRYRILRVGREGEAKTVPAHTTRVDEGFFETLGIRLLRGRGITRDDRSGAQDVVVLSEPLAQQLFAGDEPVGQRLAFALEGNPSRVFTVVGVTADLVTSQMGTVRPQMFVSLAQYPTSRPILLARASGTDGFMGSAFRNAVADLDPDFVATSLRTGDRLMRRSMSDLAIHSTTAVVCAGVALSLAALGVYGVVGLMVAARTREIGVRMALGATRSRVLGTVLGDAIKVVVPGVGIGLALAVLLVRVANAPETWYDLGGVEPLAYSVAAAIAMFVALVAGLPSARRAARVNPISAIRSE